jgi:UPF0755 protein
MTRGGAVALGTVALLAACSSPPSAPARLRIPRGSRVSQVIDSLAAHRVIANPLWFRLLARVTRADRTLRPGLYDFPAGLSPEQVLDMVRLGRTVQVKFTLPEGLTLFEAADVAAIKFEMPVDSFVAAAQDSSLVRLVGLPGTTFEGYLRPETYQLEADVSPRDLVRYLGTQFVRSWDPVWNARLTQMGLTQRQLVSLASIVEGEARTDDDRPIIAGVYWNRWRKGMPLQADPTVQYAITLATGEHKSRLFEKDYLFPSTYNTYLHSGLPPGPINSPGRKSIEASLYPADVPYLYFVAGADGRHRFSTTYGEHLRTIRAIRQGR